MKTRIEYSTFEAIEECFENGLKGFESERFIMEEKHERQVMIYDKEISNGWCSVDINTDCDYMYVKWTLKPIRVNWDTAYKEMGKYANKVYKLFDEKVGFSTYYMFLNGILQCSPSKEMKTQYANESKLTLDMINGKWELVENEK